MPRLTTVTVLGSQRPNSTSVRLSAVSAVRSRPLCTRRQYTRNSRDKTCRNRCPVSCKWVPSQSSASQETFGYGILGTAREFHIAPEDSANALRPIRLLAEDVKRSVDVISKDIPEIAPSGEGRTLQDISNGCESRDSRSNQKVAGRRSGIAAQDARTACLSKVLVSVGKKSMTCW